MKKFLLISALTLAVLTGYSSCSKCELCTKPNAPEIRVCESDYSSNTQYGLVLDSYELLGYNCQ